MAEAQTHTVGKNAQEAYQPDSSSSSDTQQPRDTDCSVSTVSEEPPSGPNSNTSNAAASAAPSNDNSNSTNTISGPTNDASIFFARVAPTLPYEDLLALFSRFGTVVHLNLYRRWSTAKTSKGCGLVTFSSRAEAEAAIASLNGRHTFEGYPGCEAPMVVEWMDASKLTPRPEQGATKPRKSSGSKSQQAHRPWSHKLGHGHTNSNPHNNTPHLPAWQQRTQQLHNLAQHRAAAAAAAMAAAAAASYASAAGVPPAGQPWGLEQQLQIQPQMDVLGLAGVMRQQAADIAAATDAASVAALGDPLSWGSVVPVHLLPMVQGGTGQQVPRSSWPLMGGDPNPYLHPALQPGAAAAAAANTAAAADAAAAAMAQAQLLSPCMSGNLDLLSAAGISPDTPGLAAAAAATSGGPAALANSTRYSLPGSLDRCWSSQLSSCLSPATDAISSSSTNAATSAQLLSMRGPWLSSPLPNWSAGAFFGHSPEPQQGQQGLGQQGQGQRQQGQATTPMRPLHPLLLPEEANTLLPSSSSSCCAKGAACGAAPAASACMPSGSSSQHDGSFSLFEPSAFLGHLHEAATSAAAAAGACNVDAVRNASMGYASGQGSPACTSPNTVVMHSGVGGAGALSASCSSGLLSPGLSPGLSPLGGTAAGNGTAAGGTAFGGRACGGTHAAGPPAGVAAMLNGSLSGALSGQLCDLLGSSHWGLPDTAAAHDQGPPVLHHQQQHQFGGSPLQQGGVSLQQQVARAMELPASDDATVAQVMSLLRAVRGC